jgi:hypothetical protein
MAHLPLRQRVEQTKNPSAWRHGFGQIDATMSERSHLAIQVKIAGVFQHCRSATQ